MTCVVSFIVLQEITVRMPSFYCPIHAVSFSLLISSLSLSLFSKSHSCFSDRLNHSMWTEQRLNVLSNNGIFVIVINKWTCVNWKPVERINWHKGQFHWVSSCEMSNSFAFCEKHSDSSIESTSVKWAIVELCVRTREESFAEPASVKWETVELGVKNR